eukprot:TRINITY_DN9403_c0_g1_i1.p1 TRINITY_DN9403_c0_g1~~TRINITY_DN9403_c0_g1_i1.p1  ORF type:complete len:233 (+),score=66.87 TRINITY_DN9403_c0_g1_i1:57-755(+)
MVFFFVCSDPQYIVYMGRDKFENDDLIKYGWPEDIWFHVDSYSSAHVYLRLPPGTVDLFNVKDKDEAKQKLVDAVESVPEAILMEMAQLTKANSIEGCKLSEVDVVYTPFLNLKKEERMDTGQVGFKDASFRKLLKNVPRDKEIIKNLEKTRVERKVDLAQAKQDRDLEERGRRKKWLSDQKSKEKEQERQLAEEKEQKSYSSLQTLEMTSNAEVSKTGTVEECKELEDDFM